MAFINNSKTYSFKTKFNAQRSNSTRHVICPRCKETLEQIDVENYSKCPFCSYRFERNEDLEDFMLAPLAENWARQQHFLYNDKLRGSEEPPVED